MQPTLIAYCRSCGRRLRAPESIRRGTGPVCAKWLERRAQAEPEPEFTAEPDAGAPVWACCIPPGARRIEEGNLDG